MSRVAYATPMVAYDHVAGMLKDSAGSDNIVSRDDAKGLVEKLTKEGRGTEALAAHNLFKMIDCQDNAKGARVTGFDLTLSRVFVEQKMLQGYDVNHNGWSQDEIAKMSPTARALIELGETLQIKAKPGRISHAIPEAGMNHVAALINGAVGKDGVIVSRDDIKALGDQLYQEGRGTEALAVRYFFGFIDHRDYKLGARVTAKDVEKAVDYSGTHLLKNKDVNHNGYSSDEYAKFSTTAKAFTLVGEMIDAGIIKSAAAAK